VMWGREDRRGAVLSFFEKHVYVDVHVHVHVLVNVDANVNGLEQDLDDDYVVPFSVELAVPFVDADLAKAE